MRAAQRGRTAARTGAARWTARTGGWLRGSRAGLLAMAVAAGIGSGFGAVAFRFLVYAVTWLATGHVQFGQGGYVGSSHLPWLGLGFFVVIPVVGGLVYGPLIYRYAREARGHGVPEVMVAVADNGGRIRPQVSMVKALASALCIGTGGSVGREGPIVQIGSALASSLGQRVRLPEKQLRILVACGAGGGIAATFNAPVTGVFFGAEIILREFSAEAIVAVAVSATVADLISRAILGSAPFLSGFPAGIGVTSPRDYLLIALLAVIAALLGLTFASVLYRVEDLCDRVWAGRPEWARPAVGGVLLGLLLLAVPQLYGVGYPVMYKAVGGGYVIWFLIVLALGKIIATSLTIGIGGSGGIFAPSLFIGATSGMAVGDIAGHLLGPAAGPPALYAVVAMGAVFAAATRAPLTSLASVVEMTGDFTVALPVLLAVAIATALSRALSYGTIYTTKLLRRGIDLDGPTPAHILQDLTAADAMRAFPAALSADSADGEPGGGADGGVGGGANGEPSGGTVGGPGSPAGTDVAGTVAGPVIVRRDPQAVLAVESVAQALRQLVIYGHDGLPVLSADRREIQGWITSAGVLRAVARQVRAEQADSARARRRAGWALPDPARGGTPPDPLPAYQLVEVTIAAGSTGVGRALRDGPWPPGSVPVSVERDDGPSEPEPDVILQAGDTVMLLAPAGWADPAPAGGQPS